jgi:hypothetical protein
MPVRTRWRSMKYLKSDEQAVLTCKLEVCLTSTKGQTAYTYRGYTASDDRDIVFLERIIDFQPSVSRLERHSLLIFRQGNLVHVFKTDRNAAVDVGSSRHWRMSTAPCSVWALRQSRDQDRCRDVQWLLGFEDTLRNQLSLLSRPKCLHEGAISSLRWQINLIIAKYLLQRVALCMLE